jgi:hypothetical protein
MPGKSAINIEHEQLAVGPLHLILGGATGSIKTADRTNVFFRA